MVSCKVHEGKDCLFLDFFHCQVASTAGAMLGTQNIIEWTNSEYLLSRRLINMYFKKLTWNSNNAKIIEEKGDQDNISFYFSRFLCVMHHFVSCKYFLHIEVKFSIVFCFWIPVSNHNLFTAWAEHAIAFKPLLLLSGAW